MPVTAPADRRFLRAQVKPGRKRTPWRTRLRVARALCAACLFAALLWQAGAALVRSDMMHVRHIVVSGNHRLGTGEVTALLDGLLGSHILAVDLERWRRKVLECPWVETATLRRSLPATIEVVVSEPHPIAVGRIGDELYLVDDNGAVIDEYGPRYADLDLPILDGLGPVPGRDVETDARRARLAVRVLAAAASRPDIARRISQLDVSDPRDAIVIIDGDTARIRLGEDRFLERLESYLDLAPALRERVPGIDYVDLRFGERVYVGPQAQARQQARAGGGPRGPEPGGPSPQ